MFKNLSVGAIGIRGMALPEQIALAQQTGFAGIDFDIREAAHLAEAHGIDYVRDLFAQAGVRPGQWGLPVAWNKDDQWEADLAELPRLAAVGRALGCTRTATWCPPASDTRPFAENFAWHVARFRPIAQALKDAGVPIVGSLSTKNRHSFRTDVAEISLSGPEPLTHFVLPVLGLRPPGQFSLFGNFYALTSDTYLRTRAQLNRILYAVILTSLPIAIYGIIQHYGLDALPWGGDVKERVAANMGNAIFVAAYLIMALFLTLERLLDSLASLLNEERGTTADALRATAADIVSIRALA